MGHGELIMDCCRENPAKPNGRPARERGVVHRFIQVTNGENASKREVVKTGFRYVSGQRLVKEEVLRKGRL